MDQENKVKTRRGNETVAGRRGGSCRTSLAGVEIDHFVRVRREGGIYGEPRFCNAKVTQLPRVRPRSNRAAASTVVVTR